MVKEILLPEGNVEVEQVAELAAMIDSSERCRYPQGCKANSVCRVPPVRLPVEALGAPDPINACSPLQTQTYSVASTYSSTPTVPGAAQSQRLLELSVLQAV